MKSKKWLDIEEALGVLWSYRERKEKNREKLQAIINSGINDRVLEDLIIHRLIYLEGDDIEMTKEGEVIGRDVTRRHRLAERLLADVIEISGDEVDKTACEVEHIISSDVTDSICTLQGLPARFRHTARPLLRKSGREGRLDRDAAH